MKSAISGRSRKRIRQLAATLQVGVAGIILMPAPSEAQTGSGAVSPDEIVVTARKKAETTLDVPSTLDVFSADTLAGAGINSTAELTRLTPGLNFAPRVDGTNIALRGVSSNAASFGANPSVAVHFDGVYLPQPDMALTELFDIDRIEILKGPQGTLYGRNATGGAINLIPDSNAARGGEVSLGLGSFDLYRVRFAVGVPIAEESGIRLSGAVAKDDGYTKSFLHDAPLDNQDIVALRGIGVFKAGDAKIRLAVQYVDDDGGLGTGFQYSPELSAPGGVYAGSIQRRGPRLISTDLPTTRRTSALVGALNVSVPLGAVELQSITGFTHFKMKYVLDTDAAGNPAGIIDEIETHDQSSRAVSQELQIRTDSAAHTRVVAGLYAFRETGKVGLDYRLPSSGDFVIFDEETRFRSTSFAAFINAEVDLSDDLTLIGGGRYTSDRKRAAYSSRAGSPDESGITRSKSFTPSLQLRWRPSASSMFYANYSRGLKAGGFNVGGDLGLYGPEALNAYEIGAKGRTGVIGYEIAGFYYDYSKVQLRTLDPIGNVTRVTNDANAKVYGIEASANARATDRLTLDAHILYVDSTIRNFVNPRGDDLSGIELPLTPKWTLTGGIAYDLPLGDHNALQLRTDVKYQSNTLLPGFNNPAIERQKGYALWSATARYDVNDAIYFSMAVLNITDKLYAVTRNDYDIFGVVERYGAPRTFEARLGVRF